MTRLIADKTPRIKRRQAISLFSELYHCLSFTLRKPIMKLENGFLIISIDIDVGNKELGTINKGRNDANISRYRTEHRVGEIEEKAFPLFFDLFERFEIPATFAVRGQLMEIDDFMVKTVLRSSVRHELASHGYSHRSFRYLSETEAEEELRDVSVKMKRLGVMPQSFIFPKNSIAHLNLLEKYGYKCYRGYGNFIDDGMYIEKKGCLYDIHPSLYLDQPVSSIFLKRILDVSILKKLPFHLWFHLWDFGEKRESIERVIKNVFSPLFVYAKKKEKDGVFAFETMLSSTSEVEKQAALRTIHQYSYDR